MKPTSLSLAVALLVAGTGATAATLEYSGYMRAGIGINARGGTQVCYGLPGADTKWRLGNECDYTIEPTFNAKLGSFEGSDWNVLVMPGIYRAWGDSSELGTSELVARFGQVYTYGNRIAALGGGKAWAGRRFYNRLQTGINDQFLEKNDGDGAGLEDINVGFGKVSAAVMLNPQNAATNNRLWIPLRLTNVKTLPNGELSVYATASTQVKSRNRVTQALAADEADGMALGIYQTIGGTFGGETLLGVKHDRQGEVRNSRVVAQQSGSITKSTRFDLLGEYRVATNAAGQDSTWTALGGRTDTHITGPFRVLAELGSDRVKPDGAAARSMTKFTLAGAISAGADAWSRPTIRLFVTHAVWNDAARQVLNQTWGSGERLQQVYGDKRSGTSVGVQTEAWW